VTDNEALVVADPRW